MPKLCVPFVVLSIHDQPRALLSPHVWRSVANAMDPSVAALHAAGSLPSDHLLRIVATSSGVAASSVAQSSSSPRNHTNGGDDGGMESRDDVSVLLQRWWLTKANDPSFSTESAIRDLSELLVRGLTIDDEALPPPAHQLQLPLDVPSDGSISARFRDVAVLDATSWELSRAHRHPERDTQKSEPHTTAASVAAVRTIVSVIASSVQLQVLNLSQTPFAHAVLHECVTVRRLSLVAPTLKFVTSLLLADCQIGVPRAERGAKSVGGAVHDLCCFLNGSVPSPTKRPIASPTLGTASAAAAAALSLQTLNVSGNHLTSRDAVLLASALRGMQRLQTVNFSVNPLGSSGASHLLDALATSRSSLVSLALRRTALGPGESPTLAHRLAQLTRLCALDLADNELGVTGMTWLAPCLRGLCELESLDLSHNTLSDAGTAALVAHGSWLGSERLTTLRLASNRISSEAAATQLAAWLSELPHLEVLDISDNNLGAVGWARIGPQIRRLRSLHWLDIKGTGCHDGQSYAAIAGTLSGGSTRRQDNKVTAVSPAKNLPSLPAFPDHQSSSTDRRPEDRVFGADDDDGDEFCGLTFLSLQGNRVPPTAASTATSTDVAHLNRLLRHNGATITSLNLDDCCIGGGELTALAQPGGGGGLLECRRLAVLSLARNPFGSEAAQALSRCCLRWGGSLQHLSLRGSKLGQLGAAELLVYLSELTRLCVLDLSETVLGDGGADVLAATFSALVATGGNRSSAPSFVTSLCELHLDGNGIGRRSSAWDGLLGTLDAFPSLRTLSLASNPLGECGAVALSRFIERAPALRALDVSNGSLTNDGVVRVLTALTARTNASYSAAAASGDDGTAEGRWPARLPLEMHSLCFAGNNTVDSAASIASVVHFLKGCKSLWRVSLSIRSWPPSSAAALMRLVDERCHLLSVTISPA